MLALAICLASAFVFSLTGCGGAEQPTAAELECARYEACVIDATALRVCINGQCSCVTSHPGENRTASCVTGDPDGTYRPGAK
jgi:hypothetical protein